MNATGKIMAARLRANLIDGQDVKRSWTLGSKDYDSIVVEVNGKSYRLKCSVIVSMMNDFFFLTEKPVKHTYLAEAIPKREVYEGDQLTAVLEEGDFEEQASTWARENGWAEPS